MADLLTGRKTVTTAGTAVQLATSSEVRGVAIQALSGNTGVIEVGDSNVVASAGTQRGIRLNASEAVSIDTDDLSDVWLDSSVNGEGVSYLAVTLH